MESDEHKIIRLEKEKVDLRSSLQLLLDQVDYTAGACTITEMVGAVLAKSVIQICHRSLKATA